MHTRFVVMTHNIWVRQRWPEREPALRSLLRHTQPDILCVQELQPATRPVLDEELPGHERIDDPLPGWIYEGNIWWLTSMFEKVEYGAEDLQLYRGRRLFWVRLRLRESGRTILVSTAHFTWPGNPQELAGGPNLRLAEARRVTPALDRLAKENEPVLFVGDLNEAANAIDYLREAGYKDSFTAYGSFPQPTYPALPTSYGTPQVLDWQFHRGPLRVMNTAVVEHFAGDIAPSDHKPLVVTYSLT